MPLNKCTFNSFTLAEEQVGCFQFLTTMIKSPIISSFRVFQLTPKIRQAIVGCGCFTKTIDKVLLLKTYTQNTNLHYTIFIKPESLLPEDEIPYSYRKYQLPNDERNEQPSLVAMPMNHNSDDHD